MQAGLAATRYWVLEFPAETPSIPDQLMGWTSSVETRTQIRLQFPSLEEALKYAKDHGWDADVEGAHSQQSLPRAYAENFAWRRKIPWSH